MPRNNASLAAGIAIVAFTGLALAEVPYQSTYRAVSRMTNARGEVLHESILEGTDARNLAGDRLLRWSAGPGHERGELTGAATGKVYFLDYFQKQAVHKTATFPTPSRPAGQPVDEQIVGGVPCQAFAIHNGQDGPVVGTYWIATGTDLLVKLETRLTLPSGDERYFLIERSTVRLGADPGPLSIPAGFSIRERR